MAASVSPGLVTDESTSPPDDGGIADMSQTSMPCDRPYLGLKYQCDATPIVRKPALRRRSARKTFSGAYVSKCAASRSVSLGYFPMSVGPRLLPVYDAIE